MIRAEPAAGRTIVWLASYPKSGNTWLRALLSAYLAPDQPLDLDALVGAPVQLDRQTLDDACGIASAEMTPAELVPYQAILHAELARAAPYPLFLKTHAAFITSPDGTALFPAAASAGAIYLVRDPCDVALSYAHHLRRDTATAIARMAAVDTVQDQWPDRSSAVVPQVMGSWSSSVRSWLDQAAVPVLLLRYEDMLRDPAAGLARVLGFCGLDADPALIARAVAATSFAQLQAIERGSGFGEAPAGAQPFFRAGTSGEGRRSLRPQEIEAIHAAHGETMARSGYGSTGVPIS